MGNFNPGTGGQNQRRTKNTQEQCYSWPSGEFWWDHFICSEKNIAHFQDCHWLTGTHLWVALMPEVNPASLFLSSMPNLPETRSGNKRRKSGSSPGGTKLLLWNFGRTTLLSYHMLRHETWYSILRWVPVRFKHRRRYFIRRLPEYYDLVILEGVDERNSIAGKKNVSAGVLLGR